MAGGIRTGNLAGAAPSAGTGARASAARVANAATSITLAAMPAVVRTYLNPNSPVHTDRREPPRVASAKTAAAAAARGFRRYGAEGAVVNS
jgi:hypothetical protein